MPRESPARAVTARAVAAIAAVLLAAGCSGGEPPGTASTPAPPAATSPPSSAPTPTPDDGRPTAAPEERVLARTVADGDAAAVEGEGSAEVLYQRVGDIAVVAHVDCTACTGTAVLTGPDRRTPWGEDFAGQQATFLLDPHEDGAGKQSLWLATDGPWTLRLESWNDLPPVSGEQSGQGPAVLFLADTAPAVHIGYQPVDAADMLRGRYVGTAKGESLVFGDRKPMDEVLDLALPGVLAIDTRGSWTITPQP